MLSLQHNHELTKLSACFTPQKAKEVLMASMLARCPFNTEFTKHMLLSGPKPLLTCAGEPLYFPDHTTID